MFAHNSFLPPAHGELLPLGGEEKKVQPVRCVTVTVMRSCLRLFSPVRYLEFHAFLVPETLFQIQECSSVDATSSRCLIECHSAHLSWVPRIQLRYKRKGI
ncbi:hypothetical protein TNIN_333871 [Trichonephila inaurata madagascariensis]|uniref:Uncharacterized protein n=1 Tax=Trichonephila inaurata madagascariensis TaxID=2747483 RepID=A0A8X6YDZ3_9ARAC|nr:hypothetical protein TNIN_333871 [Trichonephila inaurata madagascariensis]